tara:strand:- start:7341 stop:9557 length:2217 start_codon:yes stop_codon:yes gene_type:complete
MFWGGEVWGQTTYNVTNTSDFTLLAGNNGAIINVNYSGTGWGKFNLGNNTNVTIRISSNASLGGAIVANNSYNLQVSGTLIGDRDLPPGSKLTFNSTGKTSNYGTIKITNGIFINNGIISNSLLFLGSTTSTNSRTIDGQVTVDDNSIYTNSSTQSGVVKVQNNGTYHNNGTQTGGLSLSSNGTVINSGTINSSNVSISSSSAAFTNTSTGVFNHTNTGSYTWMGKINLEGQSNLSGTLALNGTGTILTVNNSGVLNVGSISATNNAIVNISNSSNLSPPATINASNLTLIDNGGPGYLNSGLNTVINVTNQTALNGTAASTVNLNGKLNTTTLTSGGTGGIMNVLPTGVLTVSGATTPGNGFTLNVTGEFKGTTISSGGGGNGINVTGKGKFTTTGKVSINGFPFTASDSSKINIGGDLTVTNSGTSKLYINDETIFYVAGNTSIGELTQINDNSKVTFKGDVNITNSGNASLQVNDKGDVLIQSTLTKDFNSGTVYVRDSGQLVICNERRPNGSISGSYPTDTSSDKIFVTGTASYYGACRILPVEFLSFNTAYQPQDRSALLDWSTAKEWENSHFEIERAVNSVKTWETIGRVEGNGYSEAPVEYSFTDSDLPKSGGNIFYRLKQVDFSGNYSYSKTKSIQVNPTEGSTAWIAYPNPSTIGSDISVSLLQLQQYQDEQISLSLVNMLGEGSSTTLNSPEAISIVVSEWLLSKKAGLYILDIRWGAKSQQIKLLRN